MSREGGNDMNPIGLLALAAYAGSIVAANWFIGHVGTVCVPDGPCLIPVGFGLYAPSGVLWIGAALALRDAVQTTLGRRWAIAGIGAGALLSGVVATPALALASGTAFLLSEAADYVVYQPLRQRAPAGAVLASGLVGSVVDSAVFLGLAFGSLALLAGQVLGKWEMTAACAVAVWLWRLWRRPRLGREVVA